MLTVSEVSEIYAQHEMDISEKDAQANVEHLQQLGTSYRESVALVHKWAQQEHCEEVGDMREAAAFERDR